MRLVAALLLLVWTACYARCGVELFGVQPMAPAADQVDDCCKHDRVQTPSPESDSSGSTLPCDICAAIASGGLLLSQPLSLITLLLAVCIALVVGVPGLGAWLQAALRLASAAPCHFPDPPGRAPRFAEFLARTTCPVRGPAIAVA